MDETDTYSESPANWQSSIQELGTPLHEACFVVLDLETSGGAPHLGAAITEIGAVKVKGGEVIDTFSTLVNPRHPIPSFITSLTGIDDALVYDAPPIEAVLPDLFHFLGDEETIFVAQNAPFDLSFLKFAARAHGVGPAVAWSAGWLSSASWRVVPRPLAAE